MIAPFNGRHYKLCHTYVERICPIITVLFLLSLITLLAVPSRLLALSSKRLMFLKIISGTGVTFFSLSGIAIFFTSRIKRYFLAKKCLRQWMLHLSPAEQERFNPLITILMDNRDKWIPHPYYKYDMGGIRISYKELFHYVWTIDTTNQPVLQEGITSLVNWLIQSEKINVEETITHPWGQGGTDLQGLRYLLSYDRQHDLNHEKRNGKRLEEVLTYHRISPDHSNISSVTTIFLEHHASIDKIALNKIIFKGQIGGTAVKTVEQWQNSLADLSSIPCSEKSYQTDAEVTERILLQFLTRSPRLYDQMASLLQGFELAKSLPKFSLTVLASHVQNAFDRTGEIYREKINTHTSLIPPLVELIFDYIKPQIPSKGELGSITNPLGHPSEPNELVLKAHLHWRSRYSEKYDRAVFCYPQTTLSELEEHVTSSLYVERGNIVFMKKSDLNVGDYPLTQESFTFFVKRAFRQAKDLELDMGKMDLYMRDFRHPYTERLQKLQLSPLPNAHNLMGTEGYPIGRGKKGESFMVCIRTNLAGGVRGEMSLYFHANATLEQFKIALAQRTQLPVDQLRFWTDPMNDYDYDHYAVYEKDQLSSSIFNEHAFIKMMRAKRGAIIVDTKE